MRAVGFFGVGLLFGLFCSGEGYAEDPGHWGSPPPVEEFGERNDVDQRDYEQAVHLIQRAWRESGDRKGVREGIKALRRMADARRPSAKALSTLLWVCREAATLGSPGMLSECDIDRDARRLLELAPNEVVALKRIATFAKDDDVKLGAAKRGVALEQTQQPGSDDERMFHIVAGQILLRRGKYHDAALHLAAAVAPDTFESGRPAGDENMFVLEMERVGYHEGVALVWEARFAKDASTRNTKCRRYWDVAHGRIKEETSIRSIVQWVAQNCGGWDLWIGVTEARPGRPRSQKPEADLRSIISQNPQAGWAVAYLVRLLLDQKRPMDAKKAILEYVKAERDSMEYCEFYEAIKDLKRGLYRDVDRRLSGALTGKAEELGCAHGQGNGRGGELQNGWLNAELCKAEQRLIGLRDWPPPGESDGGYISECKNEK